MIDVCIIYIATGPYIRYWPEFHKSAEKYLFSGSARKYFLATDDPGILANCSYQHAIATSMQHKPWPMPTLERFRTFINLKPAIDSYQPRLVFFFNANTRFFKPVLLSEIMPDHLKSLVGVEHPGYHRIHPWLCPFERRNSLSCSLPWTHRKPYLQGCFLGGYSDDFWEMSYLLSGLIDEDVQNNKIPIWHDESYWNWYCRDRNVRILPSSYAYPWKPGTMIPNEANILMEIKTNVRPQNGKNILFKASGRLLRRIINRLLWSLASA